MPNKSRKSEKQRNRKSAKKKKNKERKKKAHAQIRRTKHCVGGGNLFGSLNPTETVTESSFHLRPTPLPSSGEAQPATPVFARHTTIIMQSMPFYIGFTFLFCPPHQKSRSALHFYESQHKPLNTFRLPYRLRTGAI